MAKYIERKAFIEAVKDIPMWGSVAAMFADSIPTADVAPVVHGRWIHDGCRVKGGIDWCHCSECGKSDNFCARTNYCPNCGAKMME